MLDGFPLLPAQIAAAGGAKADWPAAKIFFMALVAGAYISFGCMLLCSVGGTATALGQARPTLIDEATECGATWH